MIDDAQRQGDAGQVVADDAGPPPDAPAAPAGFAGVPLRVWGVKAVLVLGFAAGMLLSPRLWVSSRSYPTAPLWEGRDPPASMPLVLAVAVLSLAAALALPRPRAAIFLFVGLVVALCLWDQSRWQPWVYQYLFMLAALALYPWKTHDPARAAASLNACRLAVVATYFWSGLQKFNASFQKDVGPWLLEPILSVFPESARPALTGVGVWLMPATELAIALGLLWPRSRPAAAALAAAMHGMILWSLGPLGRNWNTVVWPWNVVMVALVALLFLRTRDARPRAIVWPGRAFPFGYAVLLMLGVMPVLDFVGRWDSYLSASLYSGNTIQAEVLMSREVYRRMQFPPEVRALCWTPDGGEHYQLSVFMWSITELNVPPYPADRVFRNVARRMCAHAEHPDDVTIRIESRPDRLTGERQSVQCNCGEPEEQEPDLGGG